MDMKAVIMAGGEGTRLRPLTCSLPKPLAKIANRSVMTYILKLLKKHGIDKAAATLMYLPQKITDYYGDGSEHGLELNYFYETTPLGTAGSVKNCESFLDKDFIVISGDALCDIDLTAAVKFHRQKNADATLVLYRVSQPLEYGVTVIDENSRISRFIEKPSWSKAYSDTVNTGIYILNRECLELIPKDKPFDFAKDLFPLMMDKGLGLYGYIANGYWCDIGSNTVYLNCNLDLLDKKADFEPDYKQVKAGIYSESTINDDVAVIAPCVIGKNVKIGKGAIIGPYACIDDGCIIGEGTSIRRSVIYDSVKIGKNVQIRGAVLCSLCSVKDRANIYEGAVIGEKSIIGSMCEIQTGVKVWPRKTVEDGANITENIVWGGGFKELYDDEGISGNIGNDMTPEFCARLGAAFSGVRKGDILLGYGENPALEMLGVGFASGAASTGADVYISCRCPYNAFRYSVANFGFSGGAYIRAHGERAVITLISSDGFDISRNDERKISAAFSRDDFTRASADEISEIKSFSNIIRLYESALINYAKVSLEGLSVTLDISDNMLKDIFTKVFQKLKCEVSESEEGKIGIIIGHEGSSLRLRDDEGTEYSAEKTSAFLCRAAAEMGMRKIFMPYNSPVSISETAENCEIIRVLNDEMNTRSGYKETPLMFDALFGALFALSYLKQKGIDLKIAMDSVPSFSVAETVTHTEENKGYVMRTLAEEKSGKKELLEGIRISLDKGNVLVVPMRRGGGFRIVAEATKTEIAQELCADFSQRIKDITHD